MYLKRSARHRGRGMTLVEVVAGLALLATVLAGLLVAKARLGRQVRVTESRRAAVGAADALLTAWWRDKPRFPRNAAGEVPGHADLLWRTQTVASAQAARLCGQVTRLDVFSAPLGANQTPLVTIELLLPAENSR